MKTKTAFCRLMQALLLLLGVQLGIAQAAPTYQQLKSFGKPSIGGYPQAGLIQGTDGALYGAALNGGSSGVGTVFKLNPDGTGFTVLQNFDRATTGGYPYAGLIQGADGALYGTASDGGSGGAGTVFKLNPDGTGFTVLQNFDYSSGGYPYAGLIQGADGALYGTALDGGSGGVGTVFKLNPDGTGFTVLQDFDSSTTGANPLAGLMQGTDGALYGTASQGGSGGVGTVFKLNPDGTGFIVLKNFDSSTTGANPSAGLMQGTDGALYGTAYRGGSSDYGTVFKLNPDGTGFTVLHNFDSSTTGANPSAGLMQGTDGALYGTASQGGSGGFGTVFKLNVDGTGFTILLNFDYSTTGGYPQAGLMQGTDGALYGTAYQGGGSDSGTVFKLNPDGTGFAVLKNLSYGPDIAESGYPSAGLIQGADGALYGTASQGGSGGSGAVFKLNPDGTGFTVLQNLDYSTTGRYLYGGLMQGTDGTLYGTAQQGGSSGYGTVFKLNPDGTGFTVLKNFDYFTTGRFPSAGLIQGTDGALYGTAAVGGSSDYGTVFKLNPDGTGFTVLKDNFDYFTTGGYLYGGLMQGTDGALYGTAYQGGSSVYGTVFKLNLDGTGFTVLKNFDYYTTGGHLYSGLIQGADGALYGTAPEGGSSGYGTVFKLNPDGSGFTVLQNFDSYTTGGELLGGLIQGADGALYGTAQQGGSGGYGTVFKLNPDGTDFIVLQNFDNSTTGAYPSGRLMRGTDGNLYGTTGNGGDVNAGTVFRLVFAPDADTMPPVITACPPGANLGCNPATLPDLASVIALVQATDDSGAPPVLAGTSADTTSGCTVTRTFTITATDAAGNVTPVPCVVAYTWTVDTTAPVFVNPPPPTLNLGCNPTSIPDCDPNVTATDNCSAFGVRDLLVSSRASDQVKRFDGGSGAYLGNFASGNGLDGPRGLALGPSGLLYVASGESHEVKRFNPISGAFVDTIVAAQAGGLDLAHSIVVKPSGEMFVTGLNNDRVKHYDANGVFLGDFTSAGSGLSGAHGLDFGPDGNLYVCSWDTDEVLRYDGASGAFLGVFASGHGLNGPYDLVFGPDGNLYVTSQFSHNVKRFNASGVFVDTFVTAGAGGLTQPRGLAFGPDGKLYVSSGTTDQVKRYNGTTGAFLGTFASGGGLDVPTFLLFIDPARPVISCTKVDAANGCARTRTLTYTAVDRCGNVSTCTQVINWTVDSAAPVFINPPTPTLDLGCNPASIPDCDPNVTASDNCGSLSMPVQLLVSSRDTADVKLYDGTTGALINSSFASGGGLGLPHGLAFGPDGNLYVSSRTSDQVLRYHGLTGAFIDIFASGGGLSFPHGLAFGPDGNLYVSSVNNDSVKRYHGTSGAFIDTFASGSGLGGPRDLRFGPDGHLYVCSFDTDEVKRFHGTSGVFLNDVASGHGLNQPYGLAFDPAGNLYVTSLLSDEVKRFNGGVFVDNFVPAGSGGLSGPRGLMFGPDGQLYVSSGDTHDVKRYDAGTGAYLGSFASGGGMSIPTLLIFTPSTPSPRIVCTKVDMANGCAHTRTLTYTAMDSCGHISTCSQVITWTVDSAAPVFINPPAPTLALGCNPASIPDCDPNVTASDDCGSLLMPVQLLVSSRDTADVKLYDGTTGALINSSFASGGGLGLPHGLAFGPDGNLYVSSRTSDQVLRYHGLTGAFIDIFASGGGLSFPHGLAFGPDGNLYVSSVNNDSVKRYHGITGTFIDTFASGSGLGGPRDLRFGPDGHLYVCSFDTDQVKRFHGTSGVFLNNVASGNGLNQPYGLAFDPAGNLYVTSLLSDEVKRFNGGVFVDNFVPAGSGGLSGPRGLMFGPDGQLYVSSGDTHDVKRYDAGTGAYLGSFASGGGMSIPTLLIFTPSTPSPRIVCTKVDTANGCAHTRTLTYTAVDRCGNVSTCTQVINWTVDSTPPVPNAATLPTVTGQCSATIASAPTATDACAGIVTGTTTDALTYTSQGTFTVTWTYADGNGNSSIQTQMVTVQDTTPPVLNCNLTTILPLWPADKKFNDVGLSFTATDACSPPVTTHVSVYSDEPNAPNSPDATYVGTTLTLRAQRNSGSDGRVYLIVVTVTDAVGNSTFCCKTVVVPKANNATWVADVNAQAANAMATCTATGSPLTPHVILP